MRGQRRRSRFSGFTRPSRRRGTRPSWGDRWLSIAHQKTDRTRAVANKPDVSARSAFEGKRLPRTALAKARNGAARKPAKAGVLPGKLTGPVKHSRPSKPKDKGVRKRRSSVGPPPSSLKLRFPVRRAASARRPCIWPCRSRRSTDPSRPTRIRTMESKMGAVTQLCLANRARFPPPLIEPCVQMLPHRALRLASLHGTRRGIQRSSVQGVADHFYRAISQENRRVPRPATLCRAHKEISAHVS